jgi:hypothetical protein
MGQRGDVEEMYNLMYMLKSSNFESEKCLQMAIVHKGFITVTLHLRFSVDFVHTYR